MKFIRDIIADKRDQARPREMPTSEGRADHDVMAAIFTETAPSTDTFRLDSSYQLPEPQREEPTPHQEPEDFAAPIRPPEICAEDETPAHLDGLNDWDAQDSEASADLDGLETDAYIAPSSPQPEVSFAEETPQQPPAEQEFEDDDPSDVDFKRLAASVAAQQDAPQQRPFKRFTRTQTRLHTLDLEEPEDQPAAPETAVRQAAEEPPQPAPMPQHPAPIRQRAAPAIPTPLAHTPVAEQPQVPPQPAIREPAAADPALPIDVPSPAMGRGASRAGRVKTRLLGFSPGQAAADPFAQNSDSSENRYTQYPVGWLAVVKGPGRGATFTLFSGVTIIGRGEDQTVRLDFGDNSISRSNHAAIAFDPEQNSFFIGHGSKANLVRRNDRPVLSTEELTMGDLIRIGETTLRFVPLCGPNFGWNDAQQGDAGHAS